MNWIDLFLNKVTMYSLMLYYLIALIAVAVVLSFFGVLPYNPWTMLLATSVLYGTSKIVNPVFGRLFKVRPNFESPAITGPILDLVFGPARRGRRNPVIAEVSKFGQLVGGKYFHA